MQEKYLGDTPDFGKYALLRALCNKQTGLRLGVNWYLTIGSEVDKPDNRDGNKRHHAANPQNYRPIDEELWDRLNQFQHEDKRSLEKFEGSGTLPKDTLYHSEPLSLTSFKGKINKLQERERWIETGLKTLDSADLVFVDPDNGFEGKVQRHHKRGPKFTYYDEIKGYIERGQSVVAIQFMGRQVGGVPALALAVKQKLKIKLGINGDIHILKNRAGKSILYFIIPAQGHSALVSNSLDKFLEGSTSSVFEWVTRPYSIPELTLDQVRETFISRFGKHLDSSKDEPIFDVDPEIISMLRGPGSDIADWHFEAFAEIDDLIKSNPGEDRKVSIKQVRDKWESLGHAHNYDSFEGMYYEFKRDKELEYRRRRFAELLFDGNEEEALKHLYRLLLIKDIDSLFGTSE
jgi:hypothetical protein